MRRRAILAGVAAFAGARHAHSATGWAMPDEAAPHRATWMAFGASEAVWGGKLLAPVQNALARIANAIVRFEPVNMLVRPNDLAVARAKLDPRIGLIEQPLDDLWMRDTGPVFVSDGAGKQAGIDFNFNGWGGKQTASQDRKVARMVTGRLGVETLGTRLVLEGGGIEVAGNSTGIATESCILNPNRNPGLTKAACEAELRRLMGIQKMIWLPGAAGRDITDGHVDFYARFARPGVVVMGYDPDPGSDDHAVTTENLAIVRAATDAHGQRLEIVQIDGPAQVRPAYDNKNFAAGYINFYIANGCVIIPEFGDARADEAARRKIAALFPNRIVVALNIDPIAAGGGGIHCTTQQQPV